MKRILTAAISGTIVLFLWGALSHLILFIGTGFTPLPKEDTVIQTLENALPGQGLYFFPGKDFRRTTAEQESAFEKKFETGPVGMIIYRPVGGKPFSLNKLLTQFICCLITSLIISFTVSIMTGSYQQRVLAVSLLGALSCASVSSIYWNWYEFPTSFFLAQCMDQLIGAILAGLVIVKLIPAPIAYKN
ncbi:hypothetical protein ACE38W_17815 [Chitinophaga sp. Hz27]|uniref:hypothetical protein n=1 Tax=Chitinophaga sp. Hz27 TaxID=3347169 RepID=UPI0035DCEE7C